MGNGKLRLMLASKTRSHANRRLILKFCHPTLPPGTRQQEDARRELRKAEGKFAETAWNDIGKAMIDSAAEDVRVYRDKSFPAVGLVAVRLVVSSEHGQITFEADGSKMSSSGDLYYRYGNYSEERGNVVKHEIYVMIWRANMKGDWRLVLDLRKKLPPKR